MTSPTGREATWMQKRNLLGSSAWLLTRDTSSELLTHISRTRDSVILLGIWELEIQVMFDLLCNFQWAVVEKGGCPVSRDRWRPPVHLWRSIAYSYIRLVIQINRSKRDQNCPHGDFEWQISNFRALLTPIPPQLQNRITLNPSAPLKMSAECFGLYPFPQTKLPAIFLALQIKTYMEILFSVIVDLGPQCECENEKAKVNHLLLLRCNL